METEYIQPDFYHFSEDSLFLVKVALRVMESSSFFDSQFCLLDLFSGCGVVGLEIIKKIKRSDTLKEAVFIEKNKMMIECLEQNIASQIPKENNIDTLTISGDIFDQFGIKNFSSKYKKNFFVMNPPYFKSNPSREPKNKNKKHARFFEQGQSILSVLNNLDLWAEKNDLDIMGLALYRRDQYPKDFIKNCRIKLRNIRLSEMRESIPKTNLLKFESI